MRKLFYLVRRFVWYTNQAKSEITAPIDGFSTLLSVLTFLAVVFAIKLSWWIYALIFGGLFLLLGIAGIVMVKTGWLKYVQHLNNSQNEVLLDIQERIKDLQNARTN